LTEALVETQAVDGDGAKDRPDLRRVIPLTALSVAALGTRTLRLQVRRHLLLHDDLLQAFEDRFAFGEREAQRGGGQILPLHPGNLPRFGLAFIGGDHHVNRVLHGHVPSC
jgi:hypothetical protein